MKPYAQRPPEEPYVIEYPSIRKWFRIKFNKVSFFLKTKIPLSIRVFFKEAVKLLGIYALISAVVYIGGILIQLFFQLIS